MRVIISGRKQFGGGKMMKKIIIIFVFIGLATIGVFGYRWYLESKIHTIEFITNGGNELVILSVSAKEDIPDFEIPVQDGYFFAGWYTEASKDAIFDLDVMPDEDIVLYADWGSDDIVYTLYQGEYVVSAGSLMPVDVIIPKLYNGIPVTGIGYQAFYMSTTLKSIYIPNSIVSIGESAFQFSQGMESVIFEKGSQITSFTTSSFSFISAMTEIEIPASVIEIEPYVFYNTNLSSITFEENSQLETIDEYAFTQIYFLAEIELPKSLKEIGIYAFVGCSSLRTVTFEEDSELEIIGEAAFAGTLINQITLPLSLESIGQYAFAGTSLTVISIPISVTTMSANVFNGSFLTVIYVEAPSKPEGWDDNWNSDTIYVQWGSTE